MLFILTYAERGRAFGFKENSRGEIAFMFFDRFNVFERVIN
jgi:hypothetical protein